MAPLDLHATEFVLFIGGAVLTVSVFVVSILLYRHASREHRAELDRERKEQER